MDNIFIEEPATATLILSLAQALTLTGSSDGDIVWIAPSPNFPGHFYVLFVAEYGDTGTWALITHDYGETWTTHQITTNAFTYARGTLAAGDAKGTSSHSAGRVLYCLTIVSVPFNLTAYRSFDEGETWAPTPGDAPGAAVWQPGLYIEPTDQSIAYIGADTNAPNLYRTLNHGTTWLLADAANGLGLALHPDVFYGIMASHHADPDELRVLKTEHIWKTSDGGLIWRDQAQVQYEVRHLHVRHGSYDYLYLATISNAFAPPPLYRDHVLFVSIDEGSTMYGKAGEHPDQPDGGGDSLPKTCGGVAYNGLLTLP